MPSVDFRVVSYLGAEIDNPGEAQIGKLSRGTWGHSPGIFSSGMGLWRTEQSQEKGQMPWVI